MVAAPNPEDVVQEALALRASHPHAPPLDVLDLVIRGREPWLDDLREHLIPPSPFALLVAEAFGDVSPADEWRALSGPNADPAVRAAMRRMYDECVLSKFVRRYGWTSPQALRMEEERSARGALGISGYLR